MKQVIGIVLELDRARVPIERGSRSYEASLLQFVERVAVWASTVESELYDWFSGGLIKRGDIFWLRNRCSFFIFIDWIKLVTLIFVK